ISGWDEGSMASTPNDFDEGQALHEVLRWPNVRRMLRTVCDLGDACPPASGLATHGSPADAAATAAAFKMHSALLANAPPEGIRSRHTCHSLLTPPTGTCVLPTCMDGGAAFSRLLLLLPLTYPSSFPPRATGTTGVGTSRCPPSSI
ncbi:hypothetical protein Agub_g4566, partial [Astrephomene gubernaculifera]